MLNISLCTHTMGQPFFFGAIPIYEVLLYSIIKLHSGDEHVTCMDKLDGLSLWRELVKNTVEGVCQECRKHIIAIALGIF